MATTTKLKTKLRPLHDRVLIKRLEEQDERHGSIIIPDSAKEKPQEGKVIAVGSGRVTEEGKKLPLPVKEGDPILFGKYSGNVVIDKKFGSPTITKDGVTVEKEIELKDGYEDMGAQMLKEVASKTSDVAGDGTTTATVLAQAIFREGLKNVTAGANPMGLKRGIEKAVETVIQELKKVSHSNKD